MSTGKEVERQSKDLPSSPQPTPTAQPEVADNPLAPLSPTATLGHSSPELPALPDLPPLGGFEQTPASRTAGASDTSYYTASWGSPYQKPPPRSIASNLAGLPERSSSPASEFDGDSPNPKFGLAHLLPSRVPTVNRIAPSRPNTPSPDSPEQSPTRFPYLASSAKSIRQFFASPTKGGEGLERRNSASGWNLRSGWWNQQGEGKKDVELISSPPLPGHKRASLSVDQNIEPFQLDGTSDTLARTDRLRSKGHRSRDSNLTLTQEDFNFWPTVKTVTPKFDLQDAIERSRTMYSSRYADPAQGAPPPPPKDTPKNTPKKTESAKQETIPEEEAEAQAPSPPTKDEVPPADLPLPSPLDRLTPPVPIQRTESASSRTRRTVKYRGKNVHINIPRTHGDLVPLTREEVQSRFEKFGDNRLDTLRPDIHAFDQSSPQAWAQNRAEFPDPADDREARRQRSYRVLVPNKQLWDDYVAQMREDKLRALGVLLGGDSAAESPLSRQPSSTQFNQSLPFSPPLPTSSAGSQRHGHRGSVFQTGFVPGAISHNATRSIASPMSAMGNPASLHMHRQSMFSPPLQGLQSYSPQLINALTGGSHHGSPGPESADRRSPLSPFGHQQNGQGFPFGQRNELLAQMQRQKEQQLAMQMQQQAAMQQMLSSAQPPAPTLAKVKEVPEAEDDDEITRPQLRSRQGEGPEIVNPKPSHRHNISVKLERDIEKSDYHLEESINRAMDEEETDSLHDLPQKQASVQHPARSTSLKTANGTAAPNGSILTPSSTAKQNLPATSDLDTNPSDLENVAPLSGKSLSTDLSHNPWANDPTFVPKEGSVPRPKHLSHNSSRSSISNLNVGAKEFKPSGAFSPSGNPSANFNPGIFNASAFSFTPGKQKPAPGRKSSVSPSAQFKQPKSTFSALSAAAPAFNPQAASFNPGGFGSSFGGGASPLTPGKSDFSFISSGPSFKPTAPVFKTVTSTPTMSAENSGTDKPGSIFGNIKVADDGKKEKKSKAIPIVDPETLDPEPVKDTYIEGEDGRLVQSDDYKKRARTADADGDDVPLFAPIPEEQLRAMGSVSPAVETPAPVVEEAEMPQQLEVEDSLLDLQESSELPSQPVLVPTSDKPEPDSEVGASPASPVSSAHSDAEDKDIGSSPKDAQSGSTSRVFSGASTLSATAAPFEFKPSFEIDQGLRSRIAERLHAHKSSEIVEPESPKSPSEMSKTPLEISSDHREDVTDHRERLPSSVRYFDDEDQPSFQEIDEVMQRINEQGSDGGVERDVPSWPNSSPRFDVSPLPSSPRAHTFQAPLRSDAPSPSPRRPMIMKTRNVPDDSASATQDPFSDGRAVPTYDSPVHHLDDRNAAVSDWDDVVTSGQEDQFKAKAQFFGPHVSSVLKTVMEGYLPGLEQRLNDRMEEGFSRMQQPSRRARSRVTMDSDADDEDDDVETDAYSRGFSPKRDRRMDKFKVMLQEALAGQRPQTPPVQDLSHFDDLKRAIAEVQGSMLQKPAVTAPAPPTLEQMKAMIEESVAQQNEALIKQREEAVKADDEERFAEIADRLREAATRIAAEIEARSEAERRENETNKLLKITEEELALVKEAARDDSAKLRALEEATEQTRSLEADNEDTHAAMSKKLMDLSVENEALKDTLEEYRLSSDKWRRDIEEANTEREKIHASFGAFKLQADEALRIRETMRSRIEKLQDSMTEAVGQVAAERAKWAKADAEQRTRYEILGARAEAEARTRERFERELERLESQERDSYRLKAALEHEQKENVKLDKECERLAGQLKDAHNVKLELVQTQKENTRLEELVEQLKAESTEHQKTADQYAREFREAREAGRLEVQRTRSALEIDIETANNQVNIIRADMEAENARLRTELDNVRMDADTLREKHELDLEQAADVKRDALQELKDAKDVTFQELRATFEERFEELRKQHRRDLDHTIENKNQSETFLRDSHAQELQDLQDHHERTIDQTMAEKDFSESQLNDRLTLADSKIDHLQDKILHLEEKLEIAKSAAHAAALAAQSAKAPALPQPSPAPAQLVAAPAVAPSQSRLPEKISPQALRESIAVLQEQLQDREHRIESLEQELSEVDKDAPAKLKNKDTEIGWLRELIGVRVDDLSDLVNALSKPNFDREAVQNAAIRIRASIQMEQDAKERQMNGAANFPTLASISNFASPRAAQLAAAIGNWRKGGGGVAPPSGLSRTISTDTSRTQTPSKPVTTAQNFLNGLMTPPASNLRKSPSPDPSLGASRPRPLNPHHSEPRPLGGARALEKRPISRDSEISAGPSTPPLLKGTSYDQDAEESTTGYYDDDESTVEGTPRADRFRALEPFGVESDR